MSTHSEAKAQSEHLKRISDLNLVDFFAQELREIDRGENATSLFNGSIIKNLTRLGILEREMLRGSRSRSLVLTDKARGLLESR